MNSRKYLTVKEHKKYFYSTILSKELYPVAISPLEVKDSCMSEFNIRSDEHCSLQGKYEFKYITFNRKIFVDMFGLL